VAVVGPVVVLVLGSVEELILVSFEQAEHFVLMGFLHVADSSFVGQDSVGVPVVLVVAARPAGAA